MKQIVSVVARLKKIKYLEQEVIQLKINLEAFSELRDILRLSDMELPRGDRRGLTGKRTPAFEAAHLHDIEERTTTYHEEIYQRVIEVQANPVNNQNKASESIILKYLDRYSPSLFGHPYLVDKGKILVVVERTNNVAEHFFGAEKQKLRRRLGRANLGRDLEDQPAQAALVSNLTHPDYVKIVCGSLDNLPFAFSEIGRTEFKYDLSLERNNKDTELMKCISALITDEKVQNDRIYN